MSPIQVNVRRTPRGVTLFRSTAPQLKSHGPVATKNYNDVSYYPVRAEIDTRNGEEIDANCVFIPTNSFQCESFECNQQQAGGY